MYLINQYNSLIIMLLFSFNSTIKHFTPLKYSTPLQATRILSSSTLSSSVISSTPVFNKYQPKTQTQISYVNALSNPQTKMVIAIGPAGTGKSLFACKNAIQSLKKKEIEKIILTRPLVSVAGEDIGFLPGSLNNKMSIWVQPMIDIFSEHLSKKEINNLIQSNVIEVTPLLYMRGRTFKNTIIIADEIQNTTPQQLLMLLTRCGDNSKIIITGDLNQSDLKEKNGLEDFIEKYQKTSTKKTDIIKVVEFDINDIQRSELVKYILDIYNSSSTKTASTLPLIYNPHTSTQVSSSTLNSNKEYMNQVNNHISKIPNEYGDYFYHVSTSNNKTTIVQNTKEDSALIPLHHMINSDYKIKKG
jgi:phosphate starvation-inducible PhoH-like protein